MLQSEYKSHITSTFDSTRWNHYVPQRGDTVISTYAKCGTTWMEYIVLNLHYSGKDMPLLRDVSAWIERRTSRQNGDEQPIEELIDWMERIPPPRQIKTHLPLNYLPYHPEVKYLVVGRDMRDAYQSWHNHLLKTGESTDRDLHGFWQTWLDNGIDGNAPAATKDNAHPHFEFYNTWWQYRNLSNIHLVHFNNLLENLPSEIERIAVFLEINIGNELIETISQATTFSSMKQKSEQLMGNAKWIINEGENDRWKDILTNEDLSSYENKKAEAIKLGISSECLKWLETGQIG